jgi:3-methylcrotonyl-CoA carboxylase alpha subunit
MSIFDKVLIANRGEIACRIQRSLRRLGIGSVAVYSDADARARHVRMADEGRWIGAAAPADSYLRGERIIEAALASGAQAIHPGFGFLSENADFADAVAAAGLVFIGPAAASMRKMGSKAGAKMLMDAAGVPVVPGYTGEDQDPARLQAEADRIGYPLMIKAAHGGGGKGMRIVRSAAEFAAALASCQREAKGAFGRDRVLLERYVERPRHIELQIFGDHHGQVIHLGERECSAQRRYQKVLEESPSPFVTPELRAAMGAAAVRAGHAIDYANAGTVEFIVGPAGDFYFMEINTRLQVEHPVTEMVTGLDLVELQLRIAAGERLTKLLPGGTPPSRGHAIEVRLYAEDPERDFLPGSGRLEILRLPDDAEGVRIDSGVVEGDVVSVHYDPMIAKLIVHGDDRAEALRRLRAALRRCVVAGPKSNVDFLERLARHPAVVEATIDTAYLDRHIGELMGDGAALPADVLAAASVAVLLDEEAASHAAVAASSDPHSPWGRADGWRLGHQGKRMVHLVHREHRIEVVAHGAAGHYTLDAGALHLDVRGARIEDGVFDALIDSRSVRLDLVRLRGALLVHDGERRWSLEHRHPYAFEAKGSEGGDAVRAPMPGRIVAVRVDADTEVTEGQEVLVMEAMKMELTLRAPRAGKIAELRANVGEFVEADSVLLRLA